MNKNKIEIIYTIRWIGKFIQENKIFDNHKDANLFKKSIRKTFNFVRIDKEKIYNKMD
jgi:hypothetical protein